MNGACVAFLLALTLLRLLVAAFVPLSADEAYYWVWSRHLQAGYLDHPPMVALWIRAGTALAGDTPLGVRLLGPLSALAGSFLLARAGRELLGLDRARAGLAALLLNATILVGAGAVTMTPDTPLLFFWTAALACLGRALRHPRPAPFLAAAGIAVGLAFCSKYTGFLLVPAIGLFAVGAAATRRWLVREPGARVGAALALATTLPVLWWNAAHGFASFGKQGGRMGDFHPAHAPQYLAELVLGQFGLATPIVFALAVAGLVRVTRTARAGRDAAGVAEGDAGRPGGSDRTRDGARLVACAAFVPAAVFVLHAFGGRVQANWPSVVYPAACLAAAAATAGRNAVAGRARGFDWPRAGIALGVALTCVIYAQAALAPLALPPSIDVTLARLGGWRSLAAGVDRADAGLRLPIVADEYGLAAELDWNGAGRASGVAVLGVEPRWALFRLPHPSLAEGAVLLVRSARHRDAPDPARWRSAVPVATVERARGGAVAERYALFVAVPRPGVATALLPLR